MKKQIIRLVSLAVLFATMICSNVFAADPVVSVMLNGYDYSYTVEYSDGTTKEVTPPVILLFVNGDIISDADAVIKNDTTLVPLRVISNKLDADVTWYESSKTIGITKGNSYIQMEIGDPYITIDGIQWKISQAPEIINSSTYVPLRAIATAFGSEVGYIGDFFDYKSDVKIVTVQDRKEPVQISDREAAEIAINTYFDVFLPGMAEYLWENHNIDVSNINKDNIQYSDLGKTYFGRYYADFGQYYCIELFELSSEYMLVDKYDGTCYPVSGYSMVEFQIEPPGYFNGWSWYYQ